MHANRNVQVKSGEIRTYKEFARVLSKMEEEIDITNTALRPDQLDYLKAELMSGGEG